MLKLAVYLKNYKKECILGPFFKFLEAISELLMPTIMAFIINEGVARRDEDYVLRMGSLMILMAFLGYGCALICQRCAARASQGFGTALRNDVFQKTLSFSYAQVDRFGASTLTNRITNDVNQLQLWVAMSIRLLTRAPFLCVGSIVMSFFLDAKLACILLAATPILAAILYFITKNATPLYRSYQAKLDRIASLLRQDLSGVRVIRSFHKTEQEAGNFRRASGSLTDTGLAIGRISALFNPLTSLTVNGMIVLVLWESGFDIRSGRLSQGQVIAFLNYANQILLALLVVSNLILLLIKSMASAARINEILDTDPELRSPESAPESPLESPAVEFRDVSFAYAGTGDRALSHVSVSIRKGQTVGVIGGTGSGKTTFVNLIGRFYDAASGSVLVDGVPVRQYPLRVLRAKIGLVPQHAVLFTGTIAENIRWGAPGADKSAVQKAAEEAQADEFIRRLPQGYDTKVERGGANLSGGQRQRLTIARALAADPEILILDDSSSALDFLTESRLRESIRENYSGKTILTISQRVGTLKDLDRILVFDGGRLAGDGTHERLFRDCPAYREICLSQISEEAKA